MGAAVSPQPVVRANAETLVVTRPDVALTRDDWAVAEEAARSFCAGQGAEFALAAQRSDRTQILYEEGVWTFSAECL